MNLSSTQASPATELGRYQVIASLGQGGMANVYLALMSGPVGFNKLLVVKVLREDLDANAEDMMEMFLDEARLAARLNHRCIVQTYEVGEVDGRHFIAMEYLEGQPLRGVQRKFRPGRLPLAEELRVLAETAHGLHYAHELQELDGRKLSVVHRDVSPQNIFLTYDGQVKLLDFGIAKTSTSEHMTRVGVIKGKMDYIAPEQLRGDEVDRRADVFALGAMLWEAVTGKRFAGGPKVADATKAHARLTGGEAKVRDVNPSVPEQLAQLVDDALALDPAKRLGTAMGFAERIESYLATLLERPNDKTLATLLAPRFEEERANMRLTIEGRVQLLRERGRGRTLASLPSSMVRPLDFGITSSGFLGLNAPESGQSLLSASQPLALQAPAAAPRKKPPVALVVAGVLLTALGGFAVFTKSATPAASAATQAAATTTTTTTTTTAMAASPVAVAASAQEAPRGASAPVRTVSLTVTVSPAKARVTLDGARLGTLPFRGTFQASDAMHHIEISAEGYQTVRKLITFEEDHILSEVLEPVRVAAGRPVKRAAPASVAAREHPAADAAREAAPAPRQPDSAASPGSRAPGDPLRLQPKSRRFDSRDPYES